MDGYPVIEESEGELVNRIAACERWNNLKQLRDQEQSLAGQITQHDDIEAQNNAFKASS